MSTVQRKPHPLLHAYLTQLNTHPLRTKMMTSGVLSFLQEVLATHLAGVPVQRPSKSASPVAKALSHSKIEAKAAKMALYGALVSAPMGHVLVGTLQKAFAGRTSKAARFGQVIASNVFIAPIQAAVYLACVAAINGLTSPEAIIRTVKTRFFSVLKVSWVTSPLAIVIAQNFVPPELWVPWFNFVTFAMGTYLNTKVKKLTMKAHAARSSGEGDDAKERT